MRPLSILKRSALFSAICVLAPGTAAYGQSYDGAPEVHAQKGPDSSAVVDAAFDIHAAPSAVWSTLIDCTNATRFMPKLISCRVLQTGPGDRWEIREHRLKGGLFKPQMRNVFRADFTPDRKLSFHRIDGDWKTSEGVWTLSPIDGGRGTHVTYHTEVAVDGPVPEGLLQSAVAKGAPEAMEALRREVMSRAHGH